MLYLRYEEILPILAEHSSLCIVRHETYAMDGGIIQAPYLSGYLFVTNPLALERMLQEPGERARQLYPTLHDFLARHARYGTHRILLYAQPNHMELGFQYWSSREAFDRYVASVAMRERIATHITGGLVWHEASAEWGVHT